MSKKTAGIILAAGNSTRLGQAKALILVSGVPLIHRLIDTYLKSELDPIIVVCQGPSHLAIAEREDIDIVIGDPRMQMIDSVILGLEALSKDTSSVVIQPVDAPFTTPNMIAALLDGNRGVTRVLCHDARPGHPILVPRSLFAEIRDRPQYLSTPGARQAEHKDGLRGVISEHDVELIEWPNDEILADIDTLADLERWQLPGAQNLH